MSKLNQSVLVLNKTWSPINVSKVDEIICDMMAGTKCALDIDTYCVHPWDGWFDLPVGPEHGYIRANRGKLVRVPEVVICAEYNKIPSYSVKLNLKNLWLRDGGRCQYSGIHVPYKDATKDHVVPKAHGGLNTWDNLVICTKEINTRKGDRTPAQAGLKLLSKPKKPKWSPLYSSMFSRKLPESWVKFLPSLQQEHRSLAQLVND